jgi:hypothetical protein
MNQEPRRRINVPTAPDQYPGDIPVLTADEVLYHGFSREEVLAVCRKLERKSPRSSRYVDPTLKFEA